MTKEIVISPDCLKLVKAILKKNIPDRTVVVFGSRVTGDVKPHSDLDLCIMGNQALSFTQLAQLREDFSESSLPIRVDLIDWATLTPSFRKIIQAQALEI